MSVLTITSENFDAQVLQSSKPVLVDFWASWCGPCRMLAPVVEELAQEHEADLTVGKVNVDEQPMLAARYGISSIPTLILFRNGKPVSTSVGVRPKSSLEALLK